RSLNAIGQLDSWQDDFIGARRAYERVLRIRRAAATGPDHPQVAGALKNLATALLDLGEYDEARRDLEEALRIRRSRLGERHPLVASTQSNLAGGDQGQREAGTAITLHEQAIHTAEASGRDDPIVAAMLE